MRDVVANARFGLVSPDGDAQAAMPDFVRGFVGFSSSFVVFRHICLSCFARTRRAFCSTLAD